jgi:dehydrogenase/reductase SDR family protein 12
MWNKILDASIFWSFDLSGYLRHEKDFNETYHFPKGSRALITGGTSGIGGAAALEMVKHGVQVTITGRNVLKGAELKNHHPNLNFVKLDMSEWDDFDSLVDQVAQLDYLVLNAGGMPEKFSTNKQGVELQFASQLFGHYILAHKLVAAGKMKSGGRIVWVTSGGMYLKALDINTIFKNEKYNKVDTYANVKRAQVSLLPFFKKEFPNQTVTAMHPGWADTPGVDQALPEFSKKMNGRLRSPLQGADTILWLLSSNKKNESGELYFDRKKVSPHLFWYTKKSSKQSSSLERLLKRSCSGLLKPEDS